MLLLHTRVAAGGGPGPAARSPSARPARNDRVVAARGKATLQEPADDDVVARVLVLVMAFRSSKIGPVSSETPQPDPATLDFLHDLDEIAAAGGDIRQRLFG